MDMNKLIKKSKGFTFYSTSASAKAMIEDIDIKNFLTQVYSNSEFDHDKLIPPVAHFIKNYFIAIGYAHKIDPKGKLTSQQLTKKFFDFALEFDCEYLYTISDNIVDGKRYSIIGHIDLNNFIKKFGVAEITFSNEKVEISDYVWSEKLPTEFIGA